MSERDEFLNLLEGQVNRGIYVWGGNGQVLDDMSDPIAWIARHEEDPKDEDRAIALYEKRKAAGVTEIRAFDCSGLVYWALHTLGLQEKDVNSRGLYKLCTPITESELIPGDLVFHSDGTRIVHVGVRAGSEQIECRGRDVGVVKNKRKSGYWTHFGRWKFPDAPTPTPDQYVYVKGGSVRVREGDNSKTVCVGIAHRGDKLPYLGTSPNTGWYNVLYNGQSAYISNREDLTELR